MSTKSQGQQVPLGGGKFADLDTGDVIVYQGREENGVTTYSDAEPLVIGHAFVTPVDMKEEAPWESTHRRSPLYNHMTGTQLWVDNPSINKAKAETPER